MRINRQDTNGVKPLLGKGELGYDDYTAGGDTGRVYVGNGSENIPQAKKSEVVTVDGKIDTHIGRVDNPHTVTKAQVGLGSVDNTADSAKNVLSATKLTTTRNIALTGDITGNVNFDGSGNVSIATAIAANSVALGTDTTGNYVASVTQGTGISVIGTAGEGWSPTISLTNVGAAGTYRSVTTDAQGRVIAGTNPTTVSGYGLTDVYTKTENNASLALKVNNSEKGVANGLATLDGNGKVVLTQIPDSVLGQLEYMGTWNFTTMPTATEKGQYWIASTSGNGYIVGDWAVWNGSAFDKVDNTDAVATVAGRTGNVVLTKSDVGLANVDNTADASKPVSTAQQTALNLKANLASPTFTGTVSGITKSMVGLGSVDNTADGAKNVLSATKLSTSRTIGGVSFDGTANIDLPGVNTTGNQSTTGNAATATKLATTMTINGVGFDGSNNVVVEDNTKQPLDADLTSIAGLVGTVGLLKKTAANTWSLDTNTYVTSSGVTAVTGIAPIVSSGGITPVISINAATTSLPGSMSASDKTKLDGLSNYNLSAATSTSMGGIELFSDTVQSVASNAVSTTASRTYGIQLNSAGQAVVNVPWVDTNTVYTHPTTDGSLHVPATGTTNNGKVLTAGATAGSLSWTALPSAPVTSVAGKTGAVTLVNGDVGLGSVDNTADSAKNVLSATKLATARTITLSGAVTGNINFDGSANVSIATTIAANSVALGTDTTGNYVAGNTAGTGITVSGTAGEGWSPTISLTNVGAAGTYRSVTTDAQGRVIAGTNPTTVSGYAITDAQTASRTTATFTTVANTWYRIATSVVGIFMNSAEFVVDWNVANNHGSTRFAAGCHYGEAAGVSLMQTNYSKYGTSGITEARIVYHTTATSNYAYVEVKFAGAVTNVAVNVEMQDTIGWSLVSPSTAGSVPAGYTSYLHTFVPSVAITAGTYPKVTINQEGRVTSGTTLVAADIPVLDASKITTGTLPVVIGGTGVTTSTGTGNNVLSTSPTLATPNIGVATGTSFNSITGLATVAPLVAGTATVGTSTLTARQDHIHPVQTSVTGNAGSATTLATARTINGVSFNGSANITISDSTKVALTGNETIAGIKTFSSSPIVPTPTTDTQAANKAYVDSAYSGFKNYIINGKFDIWQRGPSINIAGGEERCTDMFLAYNTATTPTASRDSGAEGFYNSLKISGANSISNKHIIHKIEAINTISFCVNGDTKITFSLWLKADVNSTVKVAIRVPNTTDTWSSYTTPKTSNEIQITTSWERYSVTFDLDFVYWGGIALDVYTTTAQTSLWTTGWQLEQGSVATPFENRPYGLELSLCQRYYQLIRQRVIESKAAGEYTSVTTTLPNRMRIYSPTATLITTHNSANVGSNAISVITDTNFSRQVTASATGIIESDLTYSLATEL